MDSRNYSSFIDPVRGNINLEDEIFDVSESSPLLVEDSPLNDEVPLLRKNKHEVSNSVLRKISCL